MRRLTLALALLGVVRPAAAALNSAIVWEVESTGSDNNGCGFKTGASGTDYTYAAGADTPSPQFSSSVGAAVGASTTFTDATATFTAAIIGNVLNLNSYGTGTCTAGFYEVTARADNNNITLDRAPCSGTATLIVYKVGGACATIQKALTAMTVAGHTLHIKATAIYSISTALAGGTASGLSVRTRMIGYGSTRGDHTRAEIKASAAINLLNGAGQAWQIEDLYFNGNSQAVYGINMQSSPYSEVKNCKVANVTSYAILSVNGLLFTEVTGNSGTQAVYATTNALFNWVHDNTASNAMQASNVVFGNVVTTNTGVGIAVAGYPFNIENNTIANNTSHGVSITSAYTNLGGDTLHNNVITGNGGYGVTASTALSPNVASVNFDFNAFKSNTSGNLSGLTAGAHDVTLTVDPYVGSGDWSLNSTAGGGAACRNAGYPGVIPGSPGTGYADIGALRHQDPAGSSPSASGWGP